MIFCPDAKLQRRGFQFLCGVRSLLEVCLNKKENVKEKNKMWGGEGKVIRGGDEGIMKKGTEEKEG